MKKGDEGNSSLTLLGVWITLLFQGLYIIKVNETYKQGPELVEFSKYFLKT